MKTIVIIPTYNERETIPLLLEKIAKLEITQLAVLVVDDSSPDHTAETVIEQQKKLNLPIYLLSQPKKGGLGTAYMAGFKWALQHDYEAVISMDADLSHDPASIQLLQEKVRQGADIAIGSRYVTGGKISGWTPDRYALSWSANALSRALLGLRPHDVTAGFKCYDHRFLKKLVREKIRSTGYAFQVETITQAKRWGCTIVEIPIHFQDRTIGRSKVSRHELISSARSLGRLALEGTGARQAGKFMLVGLTNSAIDVTLTNLLHLAVGLTAATAGYIGVTVALLNSFVLNRQWTFQAKTGKVYTQLALFLLVNGSGALIHTALYTFFLAQGFWYNWAKVGAIILTTGWNFFGTKYVAFQKNSMEPNE